MTSPLQGVMQGDSRPVLARFILAKTVNSRYNTIVGLKVKLMQLYLEFSVKK